MEWTELIGWCSSVLPHLAHEEQQGCCCLDVPPAPGGRSLLPCQGHRHPRVGVYRVKLGSERGDGRGAVAQEEVWMNDAYIELPLVVNFATNTILNKETGLQPRR